MKNYCPLPFGHAMIDTRGFYHVCCSNFTPDEFAQNIRDIEHDGWQGNPYLAEIRSSFLKDEKHPGCRRCWTLESRGENSLRQRVQKEYQILKTSKDNPKILTAEVQIGNLCNLSCLMCNEESSSAFLAENKRLGIAVMDQQNFNWDDKAWANFEKLVASPDLKVLNIRGGEPFYNKRFLQMLEEISDQQCKNIMLHMTTNGTVWNERWANVLKKFRLVRLMFSIDATGELLEYIRYPISWAVLQDNISQMRTLPNVNSIVHCTTQNLNIHALDDLIDWCEQNQIYLELGQLTTPSYLRLYNLPPDLRQRAMQSLKSALQKGPAGHIEKSLTSYINLLETAEHKEALWQEFVEKISMRDRVRNRDFRNFLPTQDSQ